MRDPVDQPQRFTPITHSQSAMSRSRDSAGGNSRPGDTGVVAQDVHRAKPLVRRIGQAADALPLRNIGLHRERLRAGAPELLLRLLQRRHLNVGQDNLHPGLREPLREREPDAARRPRDDATRSLNWSKAASNEVLSGWLLKDNARRLSCSPAARDTNMHHVVQCATGGERARSRTGDGEARSYGTRAAISRSARRRRAARSRAMRSMSAGRARELPARWRECRRS